MEDPNPLLQPSPLPYGLPPFDAITDDHVLDAVLRGLDEQRAEWERIATEPEPPSVENTLIALELSGQLLTRALKVHRFRSSSLITPTVTAQQERIAPLLAAHSDALHLDPRIFERIDALHARRKGEDHDPETLRLLERTHLAFVRAGAQLDEAGRARLRTINEALSIAVARFSTLLVDATNEGALHVTDRAALSGLPEDAMAAARSAATARGLEGWLLTLVLPTGQPALAHLTDRTSREQLHRAAVGRGLGGPHDTRDTLTTIAALRAERAGLLGFDDHAAYVIADETAPDPQTVDATLRRMAVAAMANAEREAAELTADLHAAGIQGPLQPWDWAFYAERRRSATQGIDEASLRHWFPLDRVITDGVLAAATDLYGISFTRRDDLPSPHPDVRTYEVNDADGTGLGLCLIDPYARDSKRGGAWMDTLCDQSGLLGGHPVVTMTLNVPAPPPRRQALMTIDEVETAFHEFGHVVHALFSDVRYPRFSGTSVPRDFVEFPSQINEIWATDPTVLPRYAIHHDTGAPLPEGVADRLRDPTPDGEGFQTTEYLAAAVLDLAWHRLAPGQRIDPDDVEAFEADALQQAGLAHPAVPPRYRSTYFAHIFGSGYSAAYYAYIWSEILDADLAEWFRERGGLRRDNGEAFRAGLLSRGGAVDPLEAYESVRGRPARIEPLLVRRGLT